MIMTVDRAISLRSDERGTSANFWRHSTLAGQSALTVFTHEDKRPYRAWRGK